MRAVVTHEAGPPEVLTLHEDWPDPEPVDGHVIIGVRAFGLNRSELFTRQGHSPSVIWPRVLGIECVGEVLDAGGTDLRIGQRVAAIMGGMGRDFDGGYAERCRVPRAHVFPVDTDLDWATFGAIPEMFQTAAGSVRVLDLRPGQVLVVRGGTSSVGLTAIALAKERGCTVFATTRTAEKADRLRSQGADIALVGDEDLAATVHQIHPAGADAVLELVGTRTLHNSLRCVRPGGVVCMTGILGGQWVWPDFEPMVDIPTGVRLTAYSGGSTDLDPAALEAYCARVAAGEVDVPMGEVFGLDELVEAHRGMEANLFAGKCVGVIRPEDRQ